MRPKGSSKTTMDSSAPIGVHRPVTVWETSIMSAKMGPMHCDHDNFVVIGADVAVVCRDCGAQGRTRTTKVGERAFEETIVWEETK